ncbi:hypothetical protein V865_000573 [Kwoniella europaea PYCC6329]|uniref:CUE domain-containing protein n=1 Tax=Kwoniella europaea PYCC6329 TaxID=1423913 RepID=A0AAX4K9F4_9TREE
MSSSSSTDTNQAQAELETLLFNDPNPEVKKLLIKGESINIKEMANRLIENGVKVEKQQARSQPSFLQQQQQQQIVNGKEKEKDVSSNKIIPTPPAVSTTAYQPPRPGTSGFEYWGSTGGRGSVFDGWRSGDDSDYWERDRTAAVKRHMENPYP